MAGGGHDATRGNRVNVDPRAPEHASVRVVATAATGNKVFVHVAEVDRDGFVGTCEQARTTGGGNLLIASESSEPLHWPASAD